MERRLKENSPLDGSSGEGILFRAISTSTYPRRSRLSVVTYGDKWSGITSPGVTLRICHYIRMVGMPGASTGCDALELSHSNGGNSFSNPIVYVYVYKNAAHCLYIVGRVSNMTRFENSFKNTFLDSCTLEMNITIALLTTCSQREAVCNMIVKPPQSGGHNYNSVILKSITNRFFLVLSDPAFYFCYINSCSEDEVLLKNHEAFDPCCCANIC